MSRQAQNIPQNYAEVREQLSDIDWHMQCMTRRRRWRRGEEQGQEPEQAPGLARIMKNISILQIKSFRQGWVSQGKARQDRTGTEAGTMPGSANPCQKSWTLPGLAPLSRSLSLCPCCAHTPESSLFLQHPEHISICEDSELRRLRILAVAEKWARLVRGLLQELPDFKAGHTIHILLFCKLSKRTLLKASLGKSLVFCCCCCFVRAKSLCKFISSLRPGSCIIQRPTSSSCPASSLSASSSASASAWEHYLMPDVLLRLRLSDLKPHWRLCLPCWRFCTAYILGAAPAAPAVVAAVVVCCPQVSAFALLQLLRWRAQLQQ